MNLKRRLRLFLTCSIVLLTGQACADSTLAQRALKPVIQYQCENELKQSKVWKVSTYLMSDLNKQKLQNEVCDCVSKNALNDIPAKDLVKATVSEEAKNELAKKAVLNSVKACVLELKN